MISNSLPKKLKKDAILESLFEIQFDTSEIQEVLIGRISSADIWKKFTTNRLPIANK